MSNVFTLAWRMPCSGIRATVSSSCHSPMVPSSALPPFQPWTLFHKPCVWRQLHTDEPASKHLIRAVQNAVQSPTFVPLYSRGTTSPSWRPVPSRSFATRKSKPSPNLQSKAKKQPQAKSQTGSQLPSQSQTQPYEKGIPVITRPLSASEIQSIFGAAPKLSPSLANRTLAVLQGRRVNGTLELVLPFDITLGLKPHNIEAALEWLRKNHPVDEDAAIVARVEREEREAEQRELEEIKKAEELGLYRPQSGAFGTKLGQNNDIYGPSVLVEIRKKNEARRLEEEARIEEEEERKRKEWLEGEAKYQEQWKTQLERHMQVQKYDANAVIEARPRADPKEQPLLAWIQKHHLKATSLEDTSHITNRQRILPALAVTLITLALCYGYAEIYEPCPRDQRMWPNIPPAAATVMTLIGMNVFIFTLWKAWPPAWRMLNRYFISVPIYPYAISVVGNVFSHQQFKHLAWNMVLLWFIGTRVHDEIGRGNFIALYLGAGVFASFVSLTSRVLLNHISVMSLGASGGVSGLVAAWCTLHANDRLTLFIVPVEWQGFFSAKGWEFLVGITVAEIVSMVLAIRRGTGRFDHWSHLGGLFAGTVWAMAYKSKKESDKGNRKGGGPSQLNLTQRLEGLMGVTRK